MSLDTDATNTGNMQEKVQYKSHELSGYNGYSAQKILEILKSYERLLIYGDENIARDLEKENNYPKTWLNFVASHL